MIGVVISPCTIADVKAWATPSDTIDGPVMIRSKGGTRVPGRVLRTVAVGVGVLVAVEVSGTIVDVARVWGVVVAVSASGGVGQSKVGVAVAVDVREGVDVDVAPVCVAVAVAVNWVVPVARGVGVVDGALASVAVGVEVAVDVCREETVVADGVAVDEPCGVWVAVADEVTVGVAVPLGGALMMP